MHLLGRLVTQEELTELLSYPLTPYAHPYFGQFFLAETGFMSLKIVKSSKIIPVH
jgi:hypothetical protein